MLPMESSLTCCGRVKSTSFLNCNCIIVTDTAYTKRTSSNGQEEWYIFDDTYVGKIDEKEVVVS